MANNNETVEQVCGEFKTSSHTCKNCDFEVCPSIIVFSDRIIAAHNREIDELKTQIKIAKDAFFNISMCDHSQKIHDIFCEAEFMMNHPEMRGDGNGER